MFAFQRACNDSLWILRKRFVSEKHIPYIIEAAFRLALLFHGAKTQARRDWDLGPLELVWCRSWIHLDLVLRVPFGTFGIWVCYPRCLSRTRSPSLAECAAVVQSCAVLQHPRWYRMAVTALLEVHICSLSQHSRASLTWPLDSSGFGLAPIWPSVLWCRPIWDPWDLH
jgi:hypothetical protein